MRIGHCGTEKLLIKLLKHGGGVRKVCVSNELCGGRAPLLGFFAVPELLTKLGNW